MLPQNTSVLPPAVANLLACKLRDDQLVLFVGAGLSHLCLPIPPRKDPLPLWKGLADEVEKKMLNAELNLADFDNDVPEYFDYLAEHDSGLFETSLKEILNDKHITISRCHELIKEMPWAQCWTTNYDNLLERALDWESVNGEVDFHHVKAYKQQGIKYVLHLHGLLSDFNSITLGKRSYDEWDANNPKLANHMQNHMLSKTLLFIGYGNGDRNIHAIQTWIRQATGDKLLHSSISSRHRRVESYGLFWKMPVGIVQALKNNNNISVISIQSESQIFSALQEIKNAYDKLRYTDSKSEITSLEQYRNFTSIDSNAKYSFAIIMRQLWNDAGISGWAISGPHYSRNQITLDDVFVEPNVYMKTQISDPKKIELIADTAMRGSFDPKKDDVVKVKESAVVVDPADLITQLNELNLKKAREIKLNLDTAIRGSYDPKKDDAIKYKENAALGDTVNFIAQQNTLNLKKAKELHLIEYQSNSYKTSQSIPAIEALEAQQYSVLIGAPGSGKSILLRYIGRKVANAWFEAKNSDIDNTNKTPLPFYFKLNSLNKIAGNNIDTIDVLLLSVLQNHIVQHANVSKELALSWISQPNSVLWLLDGFDEVRGLSARQDLLAGIAALARTRVKDKFVISVRPSGYQKSLGGEWVDFELLNLSDFQILGVLKNWENIATKNNDIPIIATNLNYDLNLNTALSQLRRNPLLLTLAVLFYRTSGSLPNDRWEFYTRADEHLRVVIARLRSTAELKLESYNQHWAAILGQIALQGMKNNRVYFERTEIEDIVSKYFKSQEYTSREIAYEVSIFIEAADNVLGILVAYSENSYSFLHLTFQEFHAAKWLHTSSELPTLISQNWDNPDWSELWYLYILGAKQNNNFFKIEELFLTALNHSHPRLEAYLYRPQLAILEWIGFVGGHMFKFESWSKILSWLLHLDFYTDTWKIAIGKIERWTVLVPENLKNKLLEFTKIEDLSICIPAIKALGSQVKVSDIHDSLLAAIRDKNLDIRVSAFQALGRQLNFNNNLNILISSLSFTHYAARLAIIQILSDQVQNSNVEKALLNVLHNENWNVSVFAIKALASQVHKAHVQNAFFDVLKSNDPMVRISALQALSNQIHNEKVLGVLVTALSDKNIEVCLAVADALKSQSHNLIVRVALLKALEARDKNIRFITTQALSLQSHNNSVLDALFIAIDDVEIEVRIGAIQSISSQAHLSHIQNALLKALVDENSEVRHAAINSLSNQTEVISVKNALLQALKDINAKVRVAAVQALGAQAEKNEIQIYLIKCLKDVSTAVRKAAIKILGDHSHNNNIMHELITALKSETWNARGSLVHSLVNQVHLDEVKKLLCNLSDDIDSSVRLAVIKALGTQANDKEIQSLLLNALQDKDFIIRIAAVEALVYQESNRNSESKILIMLQDKIISVRSAAHTTLSHFARLREI